MKVRLTPPAFFDIIVSNWARSLNPHHSYFINRSSMALIKVKMTMETLLVLLLYVSCGPRSVTASIATGTEHRYRRLLLQTEEQHSNNAGGGFSSLRTRSIHRVHRKDQELGFDTPPLAANMITRRNYNTNYNRNKYQDTLTSNSCKTGKGYSSDDYDDYDADLPLYGLGGKGGKGGGKGGKGYCAPTVSPAPSSSSMPSNPPSISPAPSSVPTVAPSGEPTASPSLQPTVPPTVSPTLSEAPSNAPTPTPTLSSEPSTTASPTDTLMVTDPIVSGDKDGNGDTGWETSCIDQPTGVIGGGTFQDQQFVFLYHLFVPNTTDTYQTMVDNVEKRIHNGLIEHFMLCRMEEDGENDFDWYIWSIRSTPQDTPLDDESECVPDPATNDPVAPPDSTCVRVVAQLHMTAYFVSGVHSNDDGNDGSRRGLEPVDDQYDVTEADQQILSETGSYLDGAMAGGEYNDDTEVLQVTFKGFILEGNVKSILGGGNQDMNNNIAAATGQLEAQNDDDRLITGMTILTLALLCLVLVLVFVARRRRNQFQSKLKYLKQVDEMGMDDEDVDAPTIECDASNYDWFDGGDGLNGSNSPAPTSDRSTGGNASSRNYQHDVHNCSSATCEICRRYETVGPTFLSSSLSKENKAILDDLEDLRASPSVSSRSGQRSYASSDMVAL